MLSIETRNQPLRERVAPLRQRFDKNNLLIHEIYSSIQGESSYMGLPCVFVRTTGCHLRCSYCDTAHAFFQGAEMSLKHILAEVASYKINLVEVTGGEPLLQSKTFALLEMLVARY